MNYPLVRQVLDEFTPFRAIILLNDGGRLYDGLRRSEFFIFADDEEWFIAYLPSASLLPTCFMRPRDAANTVIDICRLRNDWTAINHDGFLRNLNEILKISERHAGRRWRTVYDVQPYLTLDCNGYGAGAA